jgi:hypothetical protein
MASPAKRSRLSTPFDGAGATAAGEGGQSHTSRVLSACRQRLREIDEAENAEPGSPSRGLGSDPAGQQSMRVPRPQALLVPQPSQPSPRLAVQAHLTPRKRTFAASIANFSRGFSPGPEAATSPKGLQDACGGSGKGQGRPQLHVDVAAGWPAVVQTVEYSACACTAPEGGSSAALDVVMLEAGQEQEKREQQQQQQGQQHQQQQAGSAVRGGSVAAAPRGTLAAAAAALGLPLDAALTAVTRGTAGCCLPVASLPLLSAVPLASVLAAFKGNATSAPAAASNADCGPEADGSRASGPAVISSVLGSTPVRLWCLPLPPGTPYTSLGSICSGVLQRHPSTTALLSACWLQGTPGGVGELASGGRPQVQGAAAGLAVAVQGVPAARSYLLLLEEGFGSETLEQRLSLPKGAPLSWQEACAVASDTASALACMAAPSFFSSSWALRQAASAATPGAADGWEGLQAAPSSSPRTPPAGSAAAPAWRGRMAPTAAPEACAGSALPAPSTRLARGVLRFCPAFGAADVWLAGAWGGGGAGGRVTGAKVSLVRALLLQLLPEGEGEACAAEVRPGLSEAGARGDFQHRVASVNPHTC